MSPIFQILIIIFSVVIHEISHGYAALMLGDKTAYYEGRLTLNPIKHIDPFGSIILPLMMVLLSGGGLIFAYAKPVPYNPYNLRDQKWGPTIISLAGPAANIVLATFFGLLIRFLPTFVGPNSLVFNFISIASYIAVLNIFLAFLNLVPIPPLDGSKVLFAVLPYQWRHVQAFLEQYGFFFVLFVIFFFANYLIGPVLFIFRLISGMYPF